MNKWIQEVNEWLNTCMNIGVGDGGQGGTVPPGPPKQIADVNFGRISGKIRANSGKTDQKCVCPPPPKWTAGPVRLCVWNDMNEMNERTKK